MNLRSWLYIPGDSERKLSKADCSGADAVVLDLEDSVAPENRPVAREKVRAFLQERPPSTRNYEIWVRINSLDEDALVDVNAILPGAPDGVVLPKIDGPPDILRLENYLDAFEVAHGIEAGRTKIVAVANETPSAALRLNEFASVKFTRLVGLNWGAEDLSAAVGASDKNDVSGQLTLTYRWIRSAILLAAKAAGVHAIETVYVDYRDPDGLYVDSRAAAQEGFTGRAAIHPDQVGSINRAFAPSPEDVAMAHRITAAFNQAGGVGTVGLDGKMYDIPHLKRARNLIDLNSQYESRSQNYQADIESGSETPVVQKLQ